MERKITIYGQPITKKNSQQIVMNPRTKRPFIIPSAQYKRYAMLAKKQIGDPEELIYWPVNVECVYYMQTHRAVDLVNLQEATLDVLVDAKVLRDDCCWIVRSMDGSRVDYDKVNPRVEIRITGDKEQMDFKDYMEEMKK